MSDKKFEYKTYAISRHVAATLNPPNQQERARIIAWVLRTLTPETLIPPNPESNRQPWTLALRDGDGASCKRERNMPGMVRALVARYAEFVAAAVDQEESAVASSAPPPPRGRPRKQGHPRRQQRFP
jgi:hypothetical protein